MAAVHTSSPSGFSYAQAAKGRSPAISGQTPPSKVTSGAATPATGPFSELSPGGNWADDVEESVGEKASASQKAVQEPGKSVPVKEGAVEHAKTEEKAQNSTSGVSSPDLTASADVSTKDDDSSTARANGSSSETTWETKSSASEPSWIADREKRQADSQKSDSTVKGEKRSKDTPTTPPAEPALHEAPPPAVNFWQKRALEAKAKVGPAQPATVKSTSNTSRPDVPAVKENQRPRADSRKKAMSVGGLPKGSESPFQTGNEQRKPSKPVNDVRTGSFQAGSKSSTEDATSGHAPRGSAQTRSSLPSIPTAPTYVSNAGSWPTPESAQEPERKDTGSKATPENAGEELTASGKARHKQEWQKIAVTPTIRWDAQNARGADGRRPPGSERGRGGSVRGRGGFRGGATGANGGDRAAPRDSTSQADDEGRNNAEQRGRSNTADRQGMPPPPKPNRASSESSKQESNSSARTGRGSRGQSQTETDRPAGTGQPPAQQTTMDNAANTWLDTQPEVPRTSSPAQADTASSESQDTERIPEPIPRRSSVGTQTDSSERLPSAPREGPPIRMVPSESRKEARSFDNYKDQQSNGAPRSGKRGGRGRGGAREFANGHPSGHSFSNGDFATAPGFGVPPSPSGHHSTRGNHFAYPQSGRGGWTRGNPRSQSIPIENYYGRGYNGAYGSTQVPPVNTYMPGMYDYNGYPVTAMPYQPYMDQQYLMAMVSMQLEYYFSIDNLLKDMFLRKNMDSQGFVFLDVVANFNRMKQLTQDRNLLKEVCMTSENVEIRVGEDGKERLRRRDGYEHFLLPKEQREPGAQTDGPQQLHAPERPQPSTFSPGPPRGPQSAVQPGMPPRFDRRSYDAGYPVMNGGPPQFAGFPAVPESAHSEVPNGDDIRGRATKSPLREENHSPSHAPQLDGATDTEPDAFPDDQASTLLVAVQLKPDPPFHSEATRTFSNGSIDSRSIFAELEKSNTDHAPSVLNGEGVPNGVEGASAEASRHVSPHKGRSTERGTAPQLAVYWMKDQSTPSEGLPSGLTSEPYHIQRHKALDQRNHAATGTCPYDLDVLYKFWSHFLLRNFNSKMYTEFRHYAIEDGKARHNTTGLQSLVKYYDQALHSASPIRDRVVKDYVQLVNDEPSKLEGAAFKQLRAAWRNGALNLKNRKKLVDVVDPALKARLDEDQQSST